MAFNSIPAGWVDSKSPITPQLMQRIKDNDDHFNSLLSGITTGGVVNGSFELDADADGIPDGWARNLYSGGSFAIETTDPGHGAKAVKFTSPGGSGNGGGYLTMSNYAEVSEKGTLTVSFYLKSSVAGIKNIVRVFWYKKDQTACSSASTDLYSDDSTNPTAWTLFRRGCTPPADARYYKIRLIGADSADDTAGNCMFDGVSATQEAVETVVGYATTTTAGSNVLTGHIHIDSSTSSPAIPAGFNGWAVGGVKAGVSGGRNVSSDIGGCTVTLALQDGLWTIYAVGAESYDVGSSGDTVATLTVMAIRQN